MLTLQDGLEARERHGNPGMDPVGEFKMDAGHESLVGNAMSRAAAQERESAIQRTRREAEDFRNSKKSLDFMAKATHDLRKGTEHTPSNSVT